MQIVNGYICRDCTDAALAKKGIDPASKSKLPQVNEQASAERTAAPEPPPQLASEGAVGTRLHVKA